MVACEAFELMQDEQVVMRTDKVGHAFEIGNTHELILTDKALICINKSLFGKVKKITRYQLSDIRMPDGKPEVKIGRVNSFTPTLDIYFYDTQERYKFSWDRDVEEWIDSITEMITGVKVQHQDEFK